MNEENEWDQNVEVDLREGPIERVSQEEVVKAVGERKSGKAAGPLAEVNVEMIATNGEIGIDVMVGMPDEWVLSVVVPIFKGNVMDMF